MSATSSNTVDMLELSEAQADALFETFNLILGQSVYGLAELLSEEVQLSAPVVSLLGFERIVLLLQDVAGGNPPAQLCAVTQHAYASHSFHSDIMQVWPEAATVRIAQRMCRQAATLSSACDSSEAVKSAIEVAGDIVARSCMSYVATLFGIEVAISAPAVTLDSAAHIAKSFNRLSHVLVAPVCVTLLANDVVGYVLFFMDVDSLRYFVERSMQLFSA